MSWSRQAAVIRGIRRVASLLIAVLGGACISDSTSAPPIGGTSPPPACVVPAGELTIRGARAAVIAEQVAFTLAGADSAPIASRCVLWTSSNPGVLKVSENGTALAVARGTTQVSASVGDRGVAAGFAVSAGYDIKELTPLLGEVVIPRAFRGGYFVGLRFQDGAYVPFAWHDGSLLNIGDCNPIGVNALGVIVCGDGSLWRGGVRSRLSMAGDSAGYQATAVNGGGVVVGYRGGCSFFTRCAFHGRPAALLPIVIDNSGVASSYGVFVNDHGDFVLPLSGHGTTSTQVYDSTGTPVPNTCVGTRQFDTVVGLDDRRNVISRSGICGRTVAPYAGPDDFAQALGMSQSGLVVGTVATPSGQGFLFTDGVLVRLNEVTRLSGWFIYSANLVNDDGVIEATGISFATGKGAPILLVPRP